MADQVKFDEPQGFVPPENLDADDTFEAMCTLKVLAGNQLQLVAVEGYEIGEGDMEEQEEQEPGAGEAAPTPPAAGAAGLGLAGANPRQAVGADQMAAGVPPERTQGYAERLGQMFRRATQRR